MRRAMTVGLALLSFPSLMISSTRGDDFAPPDWRFGDQPFSTRQEWEFKTDAIASSPDPVPPDGDTVDQRTGDGGGSPGAQWTGNGIMAWSNIDPDGTFWSDEPSQLRLDIPNWVDNEPQKLIRVQISIDILHGPDEPPTISDIFPSSGTSHHQASVKFNDGLYYEDWAIFPNPETEQIFIQIPAYVVIDQIVVDTVSNPEPSGLILIATAAMAGLAYGRRSRSAMCAKDHRTR